MQKTRRYVLGTAAALLMTAGAAREASASLCYTLGLPSCCFCWYDLGCTQTVTTTSVVNGRIVLTSSNVSCCESCPPCTHANPKSGTCTVTNTLTYTLSANFGVNIQEAGISLGLGANWQSAVTVGCTSTSNCTDCNKGWCEGGFNTTTTTYTVSETGWTLPCTGSGTITVLAYTSSFCNSGGSGCP